MVLPARVELATCGLGNILIATEYLSHKSRNYWWL